MTVKRNPARCANFLKTRDSVMLGRSTAMWTTENRVNPSRLGIEFISLTDSVDTLTPAGKAMFGMLAVFAEFEKNLIVERVNAGLDRAKKQGKQLGRPKVIVDRGRVKELHQ